MPSTFALPGSPGSGSPASPEGALDDAEAPVPLDALLESEPSGAEKGESEEGGAEEGQSEGGDGGDEELRELA